MYAVNDWSGMGKAAVGPAAGYGLVFIVDGIEATQNVALVNDQREAPEVGNSKELVVHMGLGSVVYTNALYLLLRDARIGKNTADKGGFYWKPTMGQVSLSLAGSSGVFLGGRSRMTRIA